MSFILAGLAFTVRIKTGAKVASTDKLVLLALADNANDDGRCWPGLAYLADKCEMSEDTVRRSVQRLEDAGYIHSFKRFAANGRQTSNGYTIVRERLEASERVGSHHATPPSHHATPEGSSNHTPINLSEEPIKNPVYTAPAKPKPKAPEIPKWVPTDEWQAFVEYRRKIKAPLTDHAVKVAIDKMDKLRAAGEDLVGVLNQTILSGKWTGLFPVRSDARNGYQKGSGNRPLSRHERNLEIANEIRRRADGESPVQHGVGNTSGHVIDGHAVEVDRQAVFENV